MDDQEWNEKKHRAFVRKDGIHTDDELREYAALEMNIREPYDDIQVKFIFVEDIKDGKGAIMFKMHHSFGDAVALTTIFMTCCDSFSPKNF